MLRAAFGHRARWGIASLAMVSAVFGLSIVGTTAAHASTSLNWACEGDWPFQSVQFTLAQSFTSSAPSTETVGTAFSGSATLSSWTVPSVVDGITISALQDLSLTIGTTDATVNSASLSGGANLGSTPSVSVSGTNVVVSIPGPLTSGTVVTFPKVKISLTGNAVGTLTTFISGTSYTSPGLTVTAVVPSGSGGSPLDVGAGCYPDPAETVTSTSIIS